MQFLGDFIYNIWSLLETVSPWLTLSLLVAGALRNILKPDIWYKSLGNRKFSSLVKATISGALLPICNCGVVPLGMSLYYSGSYLGNVMAFMIATPVLNPAAALICISTLGPKLTVMYVIAGLLAPIVAGMLANRFSGYEIIAPNVRAAQQRSLISLPPKEEEIPPFHIRVLLGIKWGIASLGKEIAMHIVPGVIMASFVLTIVPASFINNYLSQPNMVSILGVVALSAVMYVCATGHIPFVAALVSAGAAPGVAVAYLLAGTATNIPELMSIAKMIGKRAVTIFFSTLLFFAVFWGYATNLILKDFIPIFDVSINQGKLDLANKMHMDFPPWIQAPCATLILALFLWTQLPRFVNFLKKLFAGKVEA